MKEVEIIANEEERLADLLNYEILDSPEEETFNEIVELASWICKTPMSTISLIDSSRSWFKAKVGIVDSETPKEISFCTNVILEQDHFIVKNALTDERFFDHPFVKGDPNIRFYAGIPLVTPKGSNIGALCVIDTVPKELSNEQLSALKTLSRQAMNLIELRRYNKLLRSESLIIKEDNKVLAKLNDIKDKLFTVVSHDIRSPLAAIQNTIELFKEGLFNKEEFDLIIEELNLKVKHTTSFIDNLLFWAKSQYDGINAKPVRSNIKEIINDTLTLLYSTAESKQIAFRNKMTVDMFVYADPNMVRIIIHNLVSNAIKFCSPGDIISIGSEIKEGNKGIFYVGDTGKGMSSGVKEYIFRQDLFYSTAGTNNETGTGIGLILCKDLLAKNDGRIWVESEEEKGSTFYFTLPLG
ncbi:GAF domain-containing sensor histidine kinase [soil metagenome]